MADGLSILLQDVAVIIGEIAVLVLLFVTLGLLSGLLLRKSAMLRRGSTPTERLDGLRRRVRWTLTLLCVVASIGVIAINAYLLYRGDAPFEYTRELLGSISADFWRQAGIALAEVVGLMIVAAYVVRLLRRGLAKLEQRAKAYEQIKANDASIEAFFATLLGILTNSIRLIVLILAATLLALPPVIATSLLIILKIYLIITVGLLIVQAISALVDSLDALSKKYSSPDNWLRHYDRLSGLMPLLRRCLEYVVYVAVATLVVMQVSFIEQFATYGPPAVKIIGIFFLSRVFIAVGNLFIERSQARDEHLSEQERKQRSTLLPLMRSALKYVVYFVAFVLALNAVNLNPMPILAGAGILGIVVGLGAQSLINDLVSGLFILFESLYLVGDYIETADARGIVESIDIRTTRLRDPSGQQHILRNGQIGDIVNYSKRYTFAVVEVGVAYESDLDHVYQVLAKVGEEFNDSRENVLEATTVQGLDEFGESELKIRTITRVKPGCHQQMARELRRLIKIAFDREGIEIPYARRVLIFKPEEADMLPVGSLE